MERTGEWGILRDFMGKPANLKRKGKYVMIDWQKKKKQNKRSKNIKGERPIIAGLIEKNLIDKSSLKREK